MKATEKQIKEWKAEHGQVYILKVEDKVAYLKAPSRNVISMASTVADDPVKFNETLLNNCWIAGDEEIKTNDAYFLGAAEQMQHILERKSASLEKL